VRLLASAASGALFAVGLALSGMTDPQRVRAFLDVTGAWDPSLALVMGGAVGVGLLLYGPTLARPRPLLDVQFHLPVKTRVDLPLLGGAVLFGVGWGLSGYCPGPALMSLVTLQPAAFLFVVPMLTGMAAFHAWERSARVRAAAVPLSSTQPS